MAWPLTGRTLNQYNVLLSNLKQYSDLPFTDSSDIRSLREIIIAATDGALTPDLDDVGKRSHYWLVKLASFGFSQVSPPAPPGEIGVYESLDVGSNVWFLNLKSILDFTELRIPNLAEVNRIDLSQCPAVKSILWPSLVVAGFFLNIGVMASLTNISLPVFQTANINGVYVTTNPLLTTVSLPLFLPTDGTDVDFDTNALSAESVNHILARCVANAAFISGTVDTSGGTNAAPSGQGITDKATLIGRGVTVSTN